MNHEFVIVQKATNIQRLQLVHNTNATRVLTITGLHKNWIIFDQGNAGVGVRTLKHHFKDTTAILKILAKLITSAVVDHVTRHRKRLQKQHCVCP